MKIGFIGLGIMGESMCENIVKKHDDKVYCFDYSRDKVEKLMALGAVGCYSSTEVVSNSDLIITMVPRSENVLDICNEVCHMLNGKTWIDMSTIDPSVSLEVYKRVKSIGGNFVDAPVVKSKLQAIDATLGILIGCEPELFYDIHPILKYMGSNIIRMGNNGMGITMKICHNTLVAEIQNGVNETLNLAKKFGINEDDFAKAVSYGGAQNFYLDSQIECLKRKDWSTKFSLENMHKDLTIAKKLSEEVSFPMPGMENAKKVYDKGIEEGFNKMDFRTTFQIVKGEKEDL